ncbi:MAG: Fic family protein, partial [Mycobacterium sp.]
MGPLAGTTVKYETLPWDSSPGAAYVRAAQHQRGPYKAAISADIADLTVNLPSDALADAEDASREVTRFDAELGGEIAPFSSVLLRTESAASSNIEDLTASARAIAEAELPGARTTANAKVIVANTAAMVAAIKLADNIDAAAILAMHDALMCDVDPKSAGRWREDQVWIGGGTHGPRGAMFVPPHHSRVATAIDDMLRFVRRDDIPALPQVALAHAQFETIHPFADGNGRTG